MTELVTVRVDRSSVAAGDDMVAHDQQVQLAAGEWMTGSFVDAVLEQYADASMVQNPLVAVHHNNETIALVGKVWGRSYPTEVLVPTVLVHEGDTVFFRHHWSGFAPLTSLQTEVLAPLVASGSPMARRQFHEIQHHVDNMRNGPHDPLAASARQRVLEHRGDEVLALCDQLETQIEAILATWPGP